MGRRRWKQYQDTLYSGTRSSESATAQPHHRLYPALSSSCNPIAGSLDQIGPHHPAPSSLPSTVASTVLTTVTTTTTTTATATTLATGVVKQENLQRHHLQNHHHHPPSSVQDHHPQQQQEDPRRLRPGEIKAEVGEVDEPTDGIAREDKSSARTTADTATSTASTTAGVATTAATAATTITTAVTATSTTSTTTTTTGTTTITTRRRRGRRQNDGEDAEGEEDGDENDEETGRGQNDAEKRLKLDEDAGKPVSPLRTENDRATRDHPTANATDTEGTKVSVNPFDKIMFHVVAQSWLVLRVM